MQLLLYCFTFHSLLLQFSLIVSCCYFSTFSGNIHDYITTHYFPIKFLTNVTKPTFIINVHNMFLFLFLEHCDRLIYFIIITCFCFRFSVGSDDKRLCLGRERLSRREYTHDGHWGWWNIMIEIPSYRQTDKSHYTHVHYPYYPCQCPSL